MGYSEDFRESRRIEEVEDVDLVVTEDTATSSSTEAYALNIQQYLLLYI